MAEITQYPDYDETVPVNDVALLKLKTFVKFTAFIQPICLPNMERPASQEDQSIIISGWGDTQTWYQKPSKILQFVSVNEVARDDCSEKWNR